VFEQFQNSTFQHFARANLLLYHVEACLFHIQHSPLPKHPSLLCIQQVSIASQPPWLNDAVFDLLFAALSITLRTSLGVFAGI